MTVPVSTAQRVAEFHRAIGKAPPTVPAVPDAQKLTLRMTLLAEEVAEVQEAADQLSARLPQAAPADLIELAHELTDLLYVTYGALLSLGVNPDLTFAEIHRVNMHKATGLRRTDGKQLKPPGWQPADLRSVLGLQGLPFSTGQLGFKLCQKLEKGVSRDRSTSQPAFPLTESPGQDFPSHSSPC